MVESDNRITFTEFNEDNHVTIFVLEREEGAIRFGAKYEYYATTQGYNHLIGDWYFTSIADSFLLNQTPLSLLSIRKINNGDQKGYINLSLLSCKGIDFYLLSQFEPIKNAFDGYWKFEVGEDYIVFANDKSKKLQEVPPEYLLYYIVLAEN